MPVNLNPDALDAAHRHCADEGDIGLLARSLLSASAQLEALTQPVQAAKPTSAPAPNPNENTYDPDEDETLHFPAPPPPPARKKAHVSPPRHRK